MENWIFWLVVGLATIVVYRLLSRRVMTPKARVTRMLRRYRALERTGLSEQECLLQLLAIRRDWKRLPHRFLAELVSRLRSQEDVMRFVSVSEDYGYHRDHYPEIATRSRPGDGHGGSCLLVRPFRLPIANGRTLSRGGVLCKNWRCACNPISTLPRFPWRLRITKPGGMTMHCRSSKRASIDSRTSKIIPTQSRPLCLRQSVWRPM